MLLLSYKQPGCSLGLSASAEAWVSAEASTCSPVSLLTIIVHHHICLCYTKGILCSFGFLGVFFSKLKFQALSVQSPASANNVLVFTKLLLIWCITKAKRVFKLLLFIGFLSDKKHP